MKEFSDDCPHSKNLKERGQKGTKYGILQSSRLICKFVNVLAIWKHCLEKQLLVNYFTVVSIEM